MLKKPAFSSIGTPKGRINTFKKTLINKNVFIYDDHLYIAKSEPVYSKGIAWSIIPNSPLVCDSTGSWPVSIISTKKKAAVTKPCSKEKYHSGEDRSTWLITNGLLLLESTPSIINISIIIGSVSAPRLADREVPRCA